MTLQSKYFVLFLLVTFFALFNSNVYADDFETDLYVFESSDAIIHTEIVHNNEQVLRTSTTSRTTYAYNAFPSFDLALTAMQSRSFQYNDKTGYSHYYSLLDSNVEELLEVDYTESNEYVALANFRNSLVDSGFVLRNDIQRNLELYSGEEFFVAGKLVLEQEKEGAFTRYFFEYIGDAIFTESFYQETELTDGVPNNAEEKVNLFSEVAGVDYHFDNDMDTYYLNYVLRHYEMDAQEFVRLNFNVTDDEYFERYPFGYSDIRTRIHELMNSDFEIVLHEDRSDAIPYIDIGEIVPPELNIIDDDLDSEEIVEIVEDILLEEDLSEEDLTEEEEIEEEVTLEDLVEVEIDEEGKIVIEIIEDEDSHVEEDTKIDFEEILDELEPEDLEEELETDEDMMYFSLSEDDVNKFQRDTNEGKETLYLINKYESVTEAHYKHVYSIDEDDFNREFIQTLDDKAQTFKDINGIDFHYTFGGRKVHEMFFIDYTVFKMSETSQVPEALLIPEIVNYLYEYVETSLHGLGFEN